jgi:hypothetical protein
MMAQKYTSKPIRLSPAMRRAAFKRAVLQFHQVDHSGASFQARIFFNNPRANESTPMTMEQGYAGRFHVFGHGRCWGDPGHCDVPAERRPFDPRSPHPLTPREVEVVVTDALRKVALQSETVTITVVPVIYAATDERDRKDCFHFKNLTLLLRSSHGLLEGPLPEFRPAVPVESEAEIVAEKTQPKPVRKRRKQG